VVGGEDRVDAIPGEHQKGGFDDSAGGVGRDTRDRENGRSGADPEGSGFVRRRWASAHRLPDYGRRRTEEGESRSRLLALGPAVEHPSRCQVTRELDAGQPVR
jgi:hypothetical protein